MEEQEQVVNTTEATPVENTEAVIQEVASPETTAETRQETQTLPDEGKPSVNNELDEFGVPYKNRYMEYKRKLEKAEEEKQRILQQTQVQTQPQRQYTVAELEAFALETDNPAHKQWAISEAERLREARQAELVEKKFEGWKKQAELENIKQQTFNQVISRNPDLIVKDANGNFQGWNQNNPLFAKMNQYLSNPEVQSHPRALEIAEAFAIRDLHRASVPTISQKIAKTTNELKSLQKKTLIEGGGNQVQQKVSPVVSAHERLRKTGSEKDAALVMKEYFKAKGILPSDE